MLSEHSFRAVSDAFHRVSGIRLTPAKRALVTGRLQRLALDAGEEDLDRFVQGLLESRDPKRLVALVDKLTTNETYFFREPEHFEHLAALATRRAAAGAPPLRVWSAASSSGEEAYTVAMVLADRLGLRQPWTVVGTDLSTQMVQSARRALYPMDRARGIPVPLLKRWCLRGEGEYAGQLLVSRELRERVNFEGANLMEPLPQMAPFDVIFLRNVLIYFDPPSKADIVRRVIRLLQPDGVLYTGHAESLNGLDLPLRSLQPAVYAHA